MAPKSKNKKKNKNEKDHPSSPLKGLNIEDKTNCFVVVDFLGSFVICESVHMSLAWSALMDPRIHKYKEVLLSVLVFRPEGQLRDTVVHCCLFRALLGNYSWLSCSTKVAPPDAGGPCTTGKSSRGLLHVEPVF